MSLDQPSALGGARPLWGHILIPEMRFSPLQVVRGGAGVSQVPSGPALTLLWDRLEPRCFSCTCVYPLPPTVLRDQDVLYLRNNFTHMEAKADADTHSNQGR